MGLKDKILKEALFAKEKYLLHQEGKVFYL